MAYYPSSQVKTNLYTNGGEYILNTTKKNYKGYYFKTSDGKYYTGKQPSKKNNFELILSSLENPEPSDERIIDETNSQITLSYTLISEDFTETLTGYSKKIISRRVPNYFPTHPTEQDYQNGYFTRYFCKKNNELKYIEIQKDMFEMLQNKNPKAAWDLYTPISLQWVLKGENIPSENSTNISIASKKGNFPGFHQYFKNYSQYSTPSTNTPSNTKTNTPKNNTPNMGNSGGEGSSY